VTDAVVGGIRERGPEAVGLMIIGMARIVIAFLVLILMVIASEVVGIDISAIPFAGMTGISAFVSWLITRGERWGNGKGDRNRVSKANHRD
jgi:hypothetical protein